MQGLGIVYRPIRVSKERERRGYPGYSPATRSDQEEIIGLEMSSDPCIDVCPCYPPLILFHSPGFVTLPMNRIFPDSLSSMRKMKG